MPNRFACQFGYDQVYVGNANFELSHQGSLINGVRAWYFTIAGGNGTMSLFSPKDPRLNFTLGFFKWYTAVNQTPGMRLRTSCMKEFIAKLKVMKGGKGAKNVKVNLPNRESKQGQRHRQGHRHQQGQSTT